MRVVLLMAITINGYIAGLDDDTDWVKDIDALNQTITEFGVVIMGKRTYLECIKYNVFPYKNALNIVMTHNISLQNKNTDQILFLDKSPKEAVDLLKQRGVKQSLLMGGGHLNGSFLKEGLIDEILLDIHPIIMAKGIHLFESEFSNQQLELLNVQQINDQIIQLRYRIKK